jgi:hypothetical protein
MTNNKLAKDRASAQFDRDRYSAELLMQRLGRPVHYYHNPNAGAGRETGADVLVVDAGRRIGIQVTETDTDHVPGRQRTKEKKICRDSGPAGYAVLEPFDRDTQLASIQRAIAGKVEIAERHWFEEFDDVWLLVSAGVPEMGAIASTLVMSPLFDASALDAVTLDCLARSKYDRAYLHCILGVERARP